MSDSFHWPRFANHFASLPEPFFSRTPATPFTHPLPMHFDRLLAGKLGLTGVERDSLYLDWFTGRAPLPGGDIITTVYAGHQFGQYVPQLGDGRAHLLGQIWHKEHLWELQLKGSGRTPYSRFGDGRAVWRSSIREYLCSGAMAGLRIPTTHALTLIGSHEPVRRETIEPAAMICRVAPSFVRFGHIEFFGNTKQDSEAVKRLADFVMWHHYFALRTGDYTAWFTEIVRRTAGLMAEWQAVGFAHGVMNTDNMSILGLTLDYGPFGFLDAYDPGFICNHSDETGRYAFDRQPGIGLWNLHALAYALRSLLPAEAAGEALETYWPIFAERYLSRMQKKLGLASAENEDAALLQELLSLMEKHRADYTRTFRDLSGLDVDEKWLARFAGDPAALAWLARYRRRLSREKISAEVCRTKMNRANPRYILRNHLAEKAIRAAEDDGDFSEIARLHRLLQHPFDEQPEMEDYAAPPSADVAPLSISCSS